MDQDQQMRVLEIAIEGNLSMLSTWAMLAVLWWCLCVSLCTIVVSGVLFNSHRIGVLGTATKRLIFLYGAFFILSIVIFGLFLIAVFLIGEKELISLYAEMGRETQKSSSHRVGAIGTAIGTGSFCLFLGVWFAIWSTVRSLRG